MRLQPETALFFCFSLFRMVAVSCGQIREDEKYLLLYLHNYYRRVAASAYPNHTIANMNMLSWSSALEEQASAQITCSSWHPALSTSFTTLYNVGRYRGRGLRPLDRVLRQWYSQIDYLTPDSATLENITEAACSTHCKELARMLNAHHQQMGCAVLHGCSGVRDISVLMCLYEGGNAYGTEFDFSYGPVCTRCKEPQSFCQEGLCAACPYADSQFCDCRKTCRKDGVGIGVLNSTSCTCDCQYGNGPNCDEPCRSPYIHSPGVLDVCRVFTPDLFDCDHYGHYCPHLCSCKPMPGSVDEQEADYEPYGWYDMEEVTEPFLIISAELP